MAKFLINSSDFLFLILITYDLQNGSLYALIHFRENNEYEQKHCEYSVWLVSSLHFMQKLYIGKK